MMSTYKNSLSFSGTMISRKDKQIPDKEAKFEELFHQFVPKIFNYVCYRVPNEATAEDLTSAIFEKAFYKINTLRSIDSFGPWLFQIARNIVVDYHRQAEHHNSVNLANLPQVAVIPTGDMPEAQMIRQETFKSLQKHLGLLSDREQEIITLKFTGGLNNRQISSIIGETPSNVGTILYRAMQKLRKELMHKEISDG